MEEQEEQEVEQEHEEQQAGWRVCGRCGCQEPFQGITEECCMKTEGRECVFADGPNPEHHNFIAHDDDDQHKLVVEHTFYHIPKPSPSFYEEVGWCSCNEPSLFHITGELYFRCSDCVKFTRFKARVY